MCGISCIEVASNDSSLVPMQAYLPQFASVFSCGNTIFYMFG